MTDSYPKSSCPCNECPPSYPYFVQPDSKNPVPSSLGTDGCKDPQLFSCYNKQLYNKTVEPSNKGNTVSILNHMGIQRDPNYVPVECSNSKGCRTTWVGSNPLLLDPRRNILTKLDKPPYTGDVPVGNVCTDQIYTPYFRNYGKNYRNYSDINSGQIQYYVDSSLSESLFNPVFTNPAIVEHKVFMDPMGATKPQYDRHSLVQYDWDQCDKQACDSFTHDSIEFREDLMSRQMRKMNQQDWSLRWSSTQ
jgi:hypothetical protein